jgi:hypothetical protein
MSDLENTRVRYGARFISFVLIAGGILGILASVQMTVHFAHERHLSRMAVAVISIPVFAWCMWKAVDLWQGKASGYRWAKLLFLLQIPAVCVSRLTYEFSTGLSARVIFGQSTHRFGANIGSSLNLLISPEPLGWMLGINVVALFAVIYLVIVTSRRIAQPASGYAAKLN